MRAPPVLSLILVFEAGLAIGLSRFLDPWLTCAILALVWVGLRRRGVAWLAVAGALGFGLGCVGRSRSERSCAAVLPAGILRLPVRLLEPVGDGVAAARPENRACFGEISIRIRSGHLLAAGTRWSVTGRWLPSTRFGGRPAGILIARELIPLSGTPGLEARLRTWVTGTIGKLYGTRAGLVEALLIGRRGELDPALKAAFARSGLVHLLSISGFHVGVIFGWAVLLLRRLRVPRGRASMVAAAAVFLYVAFLGWPAPAGRAALLCGIGAWSAVRQRSPAPGVLLGVTCLGVTLLDPWAVFDLGAWLSAAAFFGAMVFARWSERAIGPAAGWRLLFASLGATLATAPLTAAALGSVALAGIGLNFAAIPLAAVAIPAVLMSVVVAPFLTLPAQALAAGGGLGLAGMEAVARAGSAIPYGAFLGSAGPMAAAPWAVLFLFALWAIGRRNTARRAALRAGWGLGILGGITLLPILRPAAADEGGGLALHFLNVGQGDAALIRTPAGSWVLVDAGPSGDGPDAGREVILPFLIRHGVRRLAAVVLSHAHLDHVGGAAAVLDEIPTEVLLEPGEPVAEPHYLRTLELAAERDIRWRPARAGDSLVVDGVVFRIVHPDTTWAHWGEDLNDDSVVLLVRSGAFEALLAGDLGEKGEAELVGRIGAVDLLKVGHHGSAGSTGPAWLAELRPRVAVVSVGRNRYGHPSPEALRRLARAGSDVWRTDREGTVSIRVGDADMRVEGRSGARQYPLAP